MSLAGRKGAGVVCVCVKGDPHPTIGKEIKKKCEKDSVFLNCTFLLLKKPDSSILALNSVLTGGNHILSTFSRLGGDLQFN